MIPRRTRRGLLPNEGDAVRRPYTIAVAADDPLREAAPAANAFVATLSPPVTDP
jgi:hypothetical protein